MANKTLLWSQLVYDGAPSPYTIGITDDPAIAALLKHTLVKEAKAKLQAVEGKNPVLTEVFKGKLYEVQESLETILPTEIETLLLMELHERLGAYLNREQGRQQKPRRT